MERVAFHAAKVIGAWNRHDVEAVIACYVPDCVYRDPNTRGAMEGHDGLRAYLTKLFGTWRMEWTIKHVHPFTDADGGLFLWHADFVPVSGVGDKKRAHGMALIELRGDLIARTEVYFDRTALLGG